MGMKMAVASKDEQERALQLVRLFEETVDCRMWCCPEIDGERYDEDDPVYLEKFYKECKRLAPRLMRVVFGYRVLFDNVCNRSADTLEFKSDLVKLMEEGRKVGLYREIIRDSNEIIHNQIVTMQCALLDIAQGNHGKAFTWLKNSLLGPGHLPDHLNYSSDEWWEYQNYDAFMDRQAMDALRDMNRC